MTNKMLNRFNETCCCCYTDLRIGLEVCTCMISFCTTHLRIHMQKTGCTLLFNVSNVDRLVVKSDVLDTEEIAQAEQVINNILKCKDYEDRFVFKENESICPHITDTSVDKIHLAKFDLLKCEYCDIKTHLYCCFTCGFIGCGRVQYGIDGNGHALQHFKEKGHSVFVFVNSITSDYNCDTFCYECDNFVVNPFCASKIVCTEFAEPGKVLVDLQKQEDVDEGVSVDSPFIGIKNGGNTCYVSSVLQLLGYISSKECLDFDVHFEFCDSLNPLDCLFCQTSRILNEMKHQRSHRKKKVIAINDFLRLVCTRLPMFEKNMQHDANEFLMMFLSVLQEAELSGVFPCITKYMSMNIEHSLHCGNCKSTSANVEEHLSIYSLFANDTQSCIESYFLDAVNKCGCGSDKIITNRLLSLPRYLILTVGRCVYENNQYVKLSRNITVNEINLDKMIKSPALANYFIEELKQKGYTEAEIRLGLHDTQDFTYKEDRIDQYKMSNRTNTRYSISGAIIHTGNSMNSGHYIWAVKDDDKFYLVNDRKVSEESVDYLDESYILCFE